MVCTTPSWVHSGKDPLFGAELGRPLDAVRLREAHVGAERLAHRVDEPLCTARLEAVLPPDGEHLDAGSVPVDPRLDPADQTVAEDHREHVVAPPSLVRLEEALPDVVEIEQAREQ